MSETELRIAVGRSALSAKSQPRPQPERGKL